MLQHHLGQQQHTLETPKGQRFQGLRRETIGLGFRQKASVPCLHDGHAAQTLPFSHEGNSVGPSGAQQGFF